MIRLILIILLILLVGLYSIPEAIICFFIIKVNPKAVKEFRVNFIRFIFKCFLFIAGVKLHIKGLENIEEAKNEKSVFIISNHRGFFDIISGYQLLTFPCGIIAKDNLKNVPILSYWMKNIDCYFLDRKDLRAGAMMVIDSIKKINDGTSIWLFPEGTRSKGDDPINDMLEFKSGAFKIPEKASCKILPIAIMNSEKVFENHKPFIKSTDIYINVGKMYSISELSENDKLNIGEYSRNIVKDLLINIKN